MENRLIENLKDVDPEARIETSDDERSPEYLEKVRQLREKGQLVNFSIIVKEDNEAIVEFVKDSERNTENSLLAFLEAIEGVYKAFFG